MLRDCGAGLHISGNKVFGGDAGSGTPGKEGGNGEAGVAGTAGVKAKDVGKAKDAAGKLDTATDDSAAGSEETSSDDGATASDGGSADACSMACQSDADCANMPNLPACRLGACESGCCTVVLDLDGTTCDDGLSCTSDDACLNGSCTGKATGCDDGLPCTLDTCDAKGCKHEPAQGACFIAGACYADGETDPGSDCQWWEGTDYVTVDPCWGVGANPPAPVCRPLVDAQLVVANNLFYSVRPLWSAAFAGGTTGAATVPCPLNSQSTGSVVVDDAYWFNGGSAPLLSACTPIDGGAHSTGLASAAPDPQLVSTALDTSSYAALRTSARAGLRPAPGSPLRGAGVAVSPDVPLVDANGSARPASPSIGALE